MNKIFGKKSDFAYVRQDGSRTVVGYNLQPVEGDSENFTWNEVYLPRRQYPSISLDVVKKAIIADINARTDEKILSGFEYEGKPVWLSIENQGNFSSAAFRAVTKGDNLPLRTKIGEDESGAPVYHEFETVEELTAFWNACQDFIQVCRETGWQEKDNIDWAPYEQYFPKGEDFAVKGN